MRALSNTTKELNMGERVDSDYTAVYKIVFPDDNFPDITTQNIIPETAEIEDSLWSGSSMCLGGCVSSCYRVTVAETEMNTEEGIKEWFWSPEMLNKKIRVYSGYEETEVVCIYEGYIKTAKRQEIRSRISIVCNDAFSMLFDKDVSSIYNSIFPQSESYKGVWEKGKLYQRGNIVKDESDGNYYMMNNCYSRDFAAITQAIGKIMRENSPSVLNSLTGIEYTDDKYGEQTTCILLIHYRYHNKDCVKIINTRTLVKNLGDDIGNIYQTVTFEDFLNAIAIYCDYSGNIVAPAQLKEKKLYRTMEASNLSGRACIAQIAESLGYCAYINENGDLAFRQLSSNSENAQEIFDYEKLTYDDYMLAPIDGICAKDSDGNTYYYPEDAANCQNIYTINENFVFFKPAAAIEKNQEAYINGILKTIYERLAGFSYQGYQIDTWGMPWLEVGDTVRFSTDEGTEITSIIQSRILKGTTKSFRDSFSAECEEPVCSTSNSCDFSSSSQLQGNTIQLVKEEIKKKLSVEELVAEAAKLGYVTADEVKANIGNYGVLTAEEAMLKYATIDYLTVLESKVIGKIDAEELDARTAALGYIKSSQADLMYADIRLANIDTANVNKEAVGQLFTEIGILQNVTIKEGAVTGELNGVRINGDWIDANTLAADRLILRGENGLVYEINATCSGLSLSELADEQYKEALSGTVLVAKSVTAEQINVDTELVRQLFAHDVTATGTITGATLKGADAEIVKGKIGDWIIKSSEIFCENDYSVFSILANITGNTPGMIKFTKKNITNAVNTGYMTGLEWYGVMESSNFRRSLYINNDGFVFGVQRDGELAAHTTNINLGELNAGSSVTTPILYADKLKLKNTNYGIEIGTTASGGTAGVRIGDLSGGNGSYTYITNDCVAQHSLDVKGQLSVGGATDGIFHAVTYRPTANLSLSTTASKFNGYNLVMGEGHVDYYSATGGDIKILKSGRYLVSAQVYFTNGFTENDIVHVFLYQNDSQVTETQYRFTTGSPYACIALTPYIVSCSAGDTISLRCYNQNGSRGTAGNAKSHITIIQL